MHNKQKVVIIGDSYNNTLGLIRSLGEAGADICLILVGHDRLFVSKSRYIATLIKVDSLNDVIAQLKRISLDYAGAWLICSNDKAARLIDDNETWLSKKYLTPTDGNKIGILFNKDQQCEYAEKCGFTVPSSLIYDRDAPLPQNLQYPLLIKPANSLDGEKSDIHICVTPQDLIEALSRNSKCHKFIFQKFIKKDYEINMIGLSTGKKVLVPGGIMKIRHYPDINSPCSYGIFLSAEKLGVDQEPIRRFISTIGYRGPFSVEFLHEGNKNYFLEFNFRHDGLAYAATASGANLFKSLIDDGESSYHVKPTYMMDLSSDYCHVIHGNLARKVWLKDFIRTKCQLNFNRKDPMPTIHYYINKLKTRFH